MNITYSEYCALFSNAYRNIAGHANTSAAKDRRFRHAMAKANAVEPPKVSPHKCRKELRNVQRHGERVTVEYRH